MLEPAEPVCGGKVDGLSDVEAAVEAAVVGGGESDDRRARFMEGRVNRHAVLDELHWGDLRHQLVQQAGVGLEQVRNDFEHGFVEQIHGIGGHHIPALGGSRVQVVDAIQVVVLRVPAEAGKTHAKVQIRRVDAWNQPAQMARHRALLRRQVVEIPRREHALLTVGYHTRWCR